MRLCKSQARTILTFAAKTHQPLVSSLHRRGRPNLQFPLEALNLLFRLEKSLSGLESRLSPKRVFSFHCPVQPEAREQYAQRLKLAQVGSTAEPRALKPPFELEL